MSPIARLISRIQLAYVTAYRLRESESSGEDAQDIAYVHRPRPARDAKAVWPEHPGPWRTKGCGFRFRGPLLFARRNPFEDHIGKVREEKDARVVQTMK